LNKESSKILIIFLLTNIILMSIWVPSTIRAQETEITPRFGFPPFINGKVDNYIGEWGGAKSYIIGLKNNSEEIGLNVTIKSLQFLGDLYILCQYEIESGYIGKDEFLGILISETDSDDINNLTDGKIIKISDSQDSFSDYYIENYNFTKESPQEVDGRGAGTNKTVYGGDALMTYEFKIPLNPDSNNNQKLEYGYNYSFTIFQGDNFTLENGFPEGILRNNSIIINIEEPSIIFYIILYNFLNPPTEINYNELVSLVLKIIIFSIAYLAFFSYIIKILISFKKQIRRIKKR